MNNLDALNYANKVLKLNNIESYKIDTELLLSKALNSSREKILINLDYKIEKKNFSIFRELVSRRVKKEPIAYILNEKEFWKSTYMVNQEVLIPRPETEIIVDEVLKLTNFNTAKRILDIGTGSGCIILSIVKERPNFYGSAIDISKKAINVAKYNAKMHHLENKIKFVNIDIDKLNHNKYDLIVSNPPYIKKFDLKKLNSDVRLYEPFLALDAGINGLSAIEKIIIKSKILLKLNGKLIFEIGENQLTPVRVLLKANKFYINEVCKDLQSHPRVIISTRIF